MRYTDSMLNIRRGQISAKCVVVIALLGAALSVSASAAPEEDLLKVTMEGRAAGADTAARDEAILNAEREIILQAIEGILPKPDLGALRKVFERLPKYIVPTPRLLKYTIEHDTAHVELEAQVRIDVLRKDVALGVLPYLRPPRKALILIAEPGIDGKLSVTKPGSAESAVVEALRAIGLDAVDPVELRAVYEGVDLLPRIQGDTQEVARLARENLADIAIVGTVTKSDDPPGQGSNVRACHATIAISIVRAGDAKMVESKAVDAVVNSENPREGCAQALEDACAKLKKEIGVPAVLAAAGAAPSEDVIIAVEDPPSGEFAKELLAALRANPAVQNPEALLQTAHAARFRMAFTGKMDGLVDYVVSKTYAGRRVGPKRVVGGHMELEVLSK